MYFVAGDGATKEVDKYHTASKSSVSKMRSQEKEIMKLKGKVMEKKKELLKIEKARAKAMFADKPKDNITPPANGSVNKSKSRGEVEIKDPEPSSDTDTKEVNDTTESLNTSESKKIQKRVSFASKLEETRDIIEEEEEEEPWYEEHKEALILMAIGCLGLTSFMIARSKKS